MRIRTHVCYAILISTSLCLTADFALAQRGRDQGGQDKVWEYFAEKYDKDADGKLSKTEYDRGDARFARLDKNKDGVLTEDDWGQRTDRSNRGRSRRGGDRAPTEAPKAGEAAPDFELVSIKDPAKTITLSSFKDNKPVALIFGSCT